MPAPSLTKEQKEQLKVLKDTGKGDFFAGKYLDAVTKFTGAIELDPSDSNLYGLRSAAYSKLDKYKSALNDAEKMVELRPNDFKGYLLKGNCLFYLSKLDEAVTAYNLALKTGPNETVLKQVQIALEKIKEQQRRQPLAATLTKAVISREVVTRDATTGFLVRQRVLVKGWETDFSKLMGGTDRADVYQRFKSAIRIQAMWRGYIIRKWLQEVEKDADRFVQTQLDSVDLTKQSPKEEGNKEEVHEKKEDVEEKKEETDAEKDEEKKVEEEKAEATEESKEEEKSQTPKKKVKDEFDIGSDDDEESEDQEGTDAAVMLGEKPDEDEQQKNYEGRPIIDFLENVLEPKGSKSKPKKKSSSVKVAPAPAPKAAPAAATPSKKVAPPRRDSTKPVQSQKVIEERIQKLEVQASSQKKKINELEKSVTTLGSQTSEKNRLQTAIQQTPRGNEEEDEEEDYEEDTESVSEPKQPQKHNRSLNRSGSFDSGQYSVVSQNQNRMKITQTPTAKTLKRLSQIAEIYRSALKVPDSDTLDKREKRYGWKVNSPRAFQF